MVAGQTLALAHLAMLLLFLAAALVSAYRARNGVRTGRKGGRYRRLSTEQMMKRIGGAPKS